MIKFIFILIILTGSLNAGAPFLTIKNKSYYQLGLNIDILEDASSKLTIYDVSNQSLSKKFKRSLKKTHNFGFTNSTFWVRLRINNQNKRRKLWYLVSNYFLQDQITLYKKIGNDFESIKTGDKSPFSTREVKGRPFVFKIYPKENSLYFIKISGTTNQIDLALYEPEYFMNKMEDETYVMGLFFGLVLAMVAYNLFIFISTRSLSYLFYVFYVFFYGINLSIWKGFFNRFYIWNYPWFNNNFLVLLSGLIVFSLSLFSITFLKINKSTPKSFNILKSFAVAGFIIVPSSFILPYSTGTKFWMLASLLLLPTILIIGIYRIKQGYRSAKYFVSAFGFMIVGTFVGILGIIGLLPNIFIINYAPIIGTALELVFLSMGLADRFNLMQEESLKIEREAKELNKRYADDLTKEVEKRTNELSEEKNSVANLLDNMGQAVFTIDIDGTVQSKAISKYSGEVFGKDIKGHNFYDLVFPNLSKTSEDFSTLQFALTTCIGGDNFQWELNKDLFPEKAAILINGKLKILSISLNGIYKGKFIDEIMMTITDITEKEVLEKEKASRELEENKRIIVMKELAAPEGKDLTLHSKEIKNFLFGTLDLINRNKSILMIIKNKEVIQEEQLNEIFRNIHTIKGNARMISLTNLSGLIHKTESNLIDSDKNDFKGFMEKIEPIHIEFEYYQKIAKEVFSITTNQNYIGDTIFTKIYNKNIQILKESLTEFFKNPNEKNADRLKVSERNLTKIPFLQHLSSLKQMVKEISEALRKKVDYSFQGDDFFMDDKTFNLLNDSIIHIIRNSIDHGIELDRTGKKERGLINIFCEQTKEHYKISIKDDGRGIDGNNIAKLAVDKKLIDLQKSLELSDEEKIELIFLPGFSSSENINDISGRGIGMDVVKNNIKKIGGDIKVKTTKNKGSEFLIRFPKEKVG